MLTSHSIYFLSIWGGVCKIELGVWSMISPSCVEPTFLTVPSQAQFPHRAEGRAVAVIYAHPAQNLRVHFFSYNCQLLGTYIRSMSLSTDYVLSHPPTYCKPIRLVTNVYLSAAAEKVRRRWVVPCDRRF